MTSLRDSAPATDATASESGSHPQVAPKVAVAPAKLISSVPDALADVTSARIDMTMQMEGVTGSGDAPLGITVKGLYDLESMDAQMTMTIDGPMAAGLGGGEIELRMVDGVMYMDVGSLAEMLGGAGGLSLPPGVKWLRLDLQEMMKSFGGSGGLGLPDSTDPTKTFEMLRDIAGDIETVGREEVRGVETTHYRTTVDLAKASDSLPSDIKSMLGNLDGAFGAIPIEVWIDDDGLLRRMDMRFDLSSLLGSVSGGSNLGSGIITMRMDLYDYGVEVDVEAPPAGETYDMSSLLGSLGGVSSGA